MMLVVNSNMGCNEVREREFLNYVDSMNMEDYKNDISWTVPQDMMSVNAVIVKQLTAAINKHDDERLIREIKNVRMARMKSHGSGMTCRVLLAMLYHSLQRASSNIANRSNKIHFMNISYMDYKDA